MLTSKRNPRADRNRAAGPRTSTAGGFAMIDYLVGSFVGLLAILVTCVLWGYSSRSLAMVMSYADLANMNKSALDRISRELRNVRTVTQVASSQISFIDFDGHRGALTYSPSDQKLTMRITGVMTNTMLTDCSQFVLAYYQRTPTAGTDKLVMTTSTNTCKVVQMQWTIAKTMPGARNITQRQVSAKVVLRNQ